MNPQTQKGLQGSSPGAVNTNMHHPHDYRYGATPDEWAGWVSLTNGGECLLPAMGSPRGNAAPRKVKSSIRHLTELHKTPSEWDTDGVHARGIKGWAQYLATRDQIRGWALVPDYNILLITREIRAIDIDISDPAFATAIENMICSTLGVQLPVRYRENSGNRTLLFRVDSPTPLNRRAVIIAQAVKDGKAVVSKQQAIELLASGQQTAIAGTHPSGSRFLMRNLDLVRGIPTVSLERLSQVWDTLRNAYDPNSKPLIVAEESQYEFIARTSGTIKNDPVLTWLEGEGYVKSYEHDGKANIRCPWERDHTTHGNDNSTSWMPAGLGGKERGAFACLHAHCQSRNTSLFLDLIGYNEASGKAAFQSTTLPMQASPGAQLKALAAVHIEGSPYGADIRAFKAEPLPGSNIPADISAFKAEQLPGSNVPPDLSFFKAITVALVTAASLNVHGADLSAFTVRGAPPQTVGYLHEQPKQQVVDLTPPTRSHSLTLQPNAKTALTRSQKVLEQAEVVRLTAATLREQGESFMRDDKTGKIRKTQENLNVAFTLSPDAIYTREDKFTGTVDISLQGGDWQPVTDNRVNKLRRMLERGMDVSYSSDDIGKGLSEAAESNAFDSAMDALDAQVWDGQPRVKAFGTNILKCTPSQYADAVSMYTWVAMAARVIAPGCKADISPIFISPNQGTGKSSTIRAMALNEDWYEELDFAKHDDDLARKMQGKVVIELPELRGLQGREAGATKAFLTQQHDSWVPKYKEHKVQHDRRCIFIGTDNRLRMLTDPTGNRRWAPLRVAVTAEFCDGPTMKRDAGQYWAEAVAIIEQFASPEEAVEHYSTIVRNLSAPYVRAATQVDPWYAAVDLFIEKQPDGTKITLQGLFAGVLSGSLAQLDHVKATRLRGIMTMLGIAETDSDVWQIPNTTFRI